MNEKHKCFFVFFPVLLEEKKSNKEQRVDNKFRAALFLHLHKHNRVSAQ